MQVVARSRWPRALYIVRHNRFLIFPIKRPKSFQPIFHDLICSRCLQHVAFDEKKTLGFFGDQTSQQAVPVAARSSWLDVLTITLLVPLETTKPECVSKDILDVVALKAITCHSFLFYFRYMDKRLSCEYITTNIWSTRTKLDESLGVKAFVNSSWLSSMQGQTESSPWELLWTLNLICSMHNAVIENNTLTLNTVT